MKPKKTVFLYPIIIACIMALFYFIIIPSLTAPAVQEISYDEFRAMLADGKIEEVEMDAYQITIIPKTEEDTVARTYYKTGRLYADDDALVEDMLAAGIKFGSPIQSDNTLMQFLLYIVLPTAATFGIIYFFTRNMTKKMGGVMSFGKNTSKLYAEKSTGKTFDDVAGQDEAKTALKEIIDFLNYPAKYTAIGAKLPKGALLVGPPGTGKTLMAKAVAGEAGVPFFSLSGSEFVEMFVGMAPPGYGICLSRRRRTPRVSSLSTRSTPSARAGTTYWAEMTNGSRR